MWALGKMPRWSSVRTSSPTCSHAEVTAIAATELVHGFLGMTVIGAPKKKTDLGKGKGPRASETSCKTVTRSIRVMFMRTSLPLYYMHRARLPIHLDFEYKPPADHDHRHAAAVGGPANKVLIGAGDDDVLLLADTDDGADEGAVAVGCDA